MFLLHLRRYSHMTHVLLSPSYIQRNFAEQARSTLCFTLLINFHNITPGSRSVKTTVLCCWPLNSSTGTVVGWVFCSRVPLTATVERRLNYAFTLPLPTFPGRLRDLKRSNPADTSRRVHVCACFHAAVGASIMRFDRIGGRCQRFIDYFGRCWDCWRVKAALSGNNATFLPRKWVCIKEYWVLWCISAEHISDIQEMGSFTAG